MRKFFWLRRTVIHSALTRVAFVLLIVAQSMLTGSLAAQTLSAAFKGGFTLPYEVKWQGEDTASGGIPLYAVFIRDELEANYSRCSGPHRGGAAPNRYFRPPIG